MKGLQYTVRGIPEEVDASLREEAAQSGKSLNTLLVEKISESTAAGKQGWTNGLEKFIGTWVEDPAFDEAMKDHEAIDPKEWE